MNAAETTLDLATVIVMLVAAITWAISIAGIYFSLRGQLSAMDNRMNNFSSRLDDGSSKFAVLESVHKNYGDRLIYLETVVDHINSKLDVILHEVKK